MPSSRKSPEPNVCCRAVFLWVALLSISAPACGETAEAVSTGERADEFNAPAVEAVVERATVAALTRGFQLQGSTRRGFLAEGGSAIHSLNLDEEHCYILFVGATAALRELDLRVFAADGTALIRAEEYEGMSAAHYCPPHPGTHYVAIHASRGNGVYRLQPFIGPPGLDIELQDLFRVAAENTESVPNEVR